MTGFREAWVLEGARDAVAAGRTPEEAYDAARWAYDAAASLVGDTVPGEFWEHLKRELGIDPGLSCCPVCGGVTPPSKHVYCLAQLGKWPEKGTTYNDDV